MNQNKFCILLMLLMSAISCKQNVTNLNEANKNWPVYLGGNTSAQYSPLSQINVENIQELDVAWEFSTGDMDSIAKTQMQCNPIIINGILYGSSPKLKVFALDASNGELKWIFDPNEDHHLGSNVNRGITYWEDKDVRRIYFAAGPYLLCLDAETGKLVSSFGIEGKVSLKTGSEEWAKDLFLTATSPGIIYKNNIIIGSRVSEGANSAPGTIRAFNLKDGKLAWQFHTIPRPGEFGYDTWPENAHLRVGGANSWAGMSLDINRGIVYIPTGSASFDFYGGNRKGENLFSNCILALDAESGQYIWHFQTVHHDLWDRDIPAPPNLVTLEQQGKSVDAVVTATKSGFIFVLDRDTGKPIFPISEINVKASEIEEEETWPTQPVPILPPPFTRQRFGEEDVTNISKSAHDYVMSKIKSFKYGEQFIPPSIQGTIIFPEFDGGAGWGGSAFNQTAGVLYVNAKENPAIIQLEKTTSKKNEHANLGKYLYQSNCAMCHGKRLEGNPENDFPSLKGLATKYKPMELLKVIESGKGSRMPGFSYLDDHKKTAIIDYLFGRGLSAKDPHEIGISENEQLLPFTHSGYQRLNDMDGYPAIKPPWGTLSAIDLNKGEIKWQVPLGEYEELSAKGIPKTGMVNHGGPVVTAGGLVFIAATKDCYFRAFDESSGEEIWKYKLPAAGFATPAVYEVDGIQYIVVACGGGKLGAPSGDKYLAFSIF